MQFTMYYLVDNHHEEVGFEKDSEMDVIRQTEIMWQIATEFNLPSPKPYRLEMDGKTIWDRTKYLNDYLIDPSETTRGT